jgi:inhibitor of cysteine peptidase
MKKLVLISLAAILLLPLLIAGCASTTQNTAPETQTIEITLDQFSTQKDVVKNIDLAVQGTLTVKLGANPTTGYSWTDAEITDPAVINQISRNYVAPDTGLVGAGGTEVWVFNSSNNPGTATIKMSYGQPWEGGEKDTFTLTINVTVK